MSEEHRPFAGRRDVGFLFVSVVVATWGFSFQAHATQPTEPIDPAEFADERYVREGRGTEVPAAARLICDFNAPKTAWPQELPTTASTFALQDAQTLDLEMLAGLSWESSLYRIRGQDGALVTTHLPGRDAPTLSIDEHPQGLTLETFAHAATVSTEPEALVRCTGPLDLEPGMLLLLSVDEERTLLDVTAAPLPPAPPAPAMEAGELRYASGCSDQEGRAFQPTDGVYAYWYSWSIVDQNDQIIQEGAGRVPYVTTSFSDAEEEGTIGYEPYRILIRAGDPYGQLSPATELEFQFENPKDEAHWAIVSFLVTVLLGLLLLYILSYAYLVQALWKRVLRRYGSEAPTSTRRAFWKVYALSAGVVIVGYAVAIWAFRAEVIPHRSLTGFVFFAHLLMAIALALVGWWRLRRGRE